jgi:hypothetical protein
MGDPPISINDTYRLGDLSTAPRFSRQTGLTLLEVYQTLEAQNAIWRLPEAFLGFWGSYIISKSSHNTRMFCSKSHWLRVEVPTSSSLSLTCTCRVILWFAKRFLPFPPHHLWPLDSAKFSCAHLNLISFLEKIRPILGLLGRSGIPTKSPW